MTPTEKAKELVDKFINYAHTNWNEDSGWDRESQKENAKQCALIAVQEILVIVKGVCEAFDSEPDDFWYDVKEEINKL